jgi:hypothetical protein
MIATTWETDIRVTTLASGREIDDVMAGKDRF